MIKNIYWITNQQHCLLKGANDLKLTGSHTKGEWPLGSCSYLWFLEASTWLPPPSFSCWVLGFPLLLSLGFLLYPGAIYFMFGFLCLYSVSESIELVLKGKSWLPHLRGHSRFAKGTPTLTALSRQNNPFWKTIKIFQKNKGSPTYLTFFFFLFKGRLHRMMQREHKWIRYKELWFIQLNKWERSWALPLLNGARPFLFIFSSNLQYNLMQSVLLSNPFYRWENWGLEIIYLVLSNN